VKAALIVECVALFDKLSEFDVAERIEAINEIRAALAVSWRRGAKGVTVTADKVEWR
jgi:hypothetical protein